MKISAGSLSEEALFARIAAAIHDVSGMPIDKIGPQSRLREDIGIAGEDGHDLFAALHEQFEMDWSGLDLGVHFRDEGFGPPIPPWRVKLSAAYFEPQPLTVGALADALRAGRWPGSSKIMRDAPARLSLHAAGWAGFLLLGAGLAVLVVSIGARIGGG